MIDRAKVAWQQVHDGWLCTAQKFLGPYTFAASVRVEGKEPLVSRLEAAEDQVLAEVRKKVWAAREGRVELAEEAAVVA